MLTRPLSRLLRPKPASFLSSSSSSSSPTFLLPISSPSAPNPHHHLSFLRDPDAHFTHLLISRCKQASSRNARHPFDETPHRTHASRTCKSLHARILSYGLRLSGKLGSSLVDLYSKTGDFAYARKVFELLEDPGGAAWNSILSAHSRRGSPEDVVRAFTTMRATSTLPDQFGFAIVLSACARAFDLDSGVRVHCDIVKTGFEPNPFCEGSLIDMYGKCGCIADARRVFDGVDCPDTISWTNMISGYVQIGMSGEALSLFSRMEDSGTTPDMVACVTALTACVALGRLKDARDIFARMPNPNAVAWNALISGHAKNGCEDEALRFFHEMRCSGMKPTRSTLGSVLSAAANVADLNEGLKVHSEAVRLGLDSNVFVGSSLINMYARCGCLEEARKVMDDSYEKNTVMWNAMLGGYLQNRKPAEVIELFLEMKGLEFQIDEVSVVSVFGACGSLKNVDIGTQLHCIVIKINLEASLYVGNAIVDVYAKFGDLNKAKKQFGLISNRDNISWNSIIVGHAHNEEEEEAISTFQRMRHDNVVPDEVSFASVISACSGLQAFEEGKQIHCLSVKYNLSLNLYVGSSLVDMYAKLEDMDAAEVVYRQLPEKGVVARNALVAGHVQNNKEEKALSMFRQMQAEGLEPSCVTFASILPACTGPSGLVMGRQLHCHILKSGLQYNDAYIGVSLLGMYLKSRTLEDANLLFSEMSESTNSVLWTAIISGHAQNGYTDDALLLFQKMHGCNVQSDQATFVSILRACADLAALRDGEELHSLIFRTGFGSDEYTCGALVDMYSKCGDVGASLQVFEELEKKSDVITWNSMIAGFAKNGYAEEALLLFRQMQQYEIKPDDVTLLAVLTACSHAGLISEGRGFFDLVPKKYGIVLRADHYACIVDLLGRGGFLKEAMEFIDRLPFEADGVIWATLLASCRLHGDCGRGKHAADELMKLEPHNPSPYVSLSSIYAASGNWTGAKMVRESMRENGARKLPGSSWLMVGNKTNVFLAGDKFHPNSVDIYETLHTLTGEIRKEGYIAELDFLLLDEE